MIGIRVRTVIAVLVAWAIGSPAAAIDPATPLAAVAAPSIPDPATLRTPAQALAEDAAEYARQYEVSPIEAIQRLRAQEESVAVTDRLQADYRDRLAGIVIEHRPVWHIVVLLTGTDPVADQEVMAGGLHVPILFRTGAPATRDAILAAIGAHQADIRAALSYGPGMGVDARTGSLVVMLATAIDDAAASMLSQRLSAIAGVPVEIGATSAVDRNLAIEGGARITGIEPSRGVRQLCTTGFVVTDGARTGVTTAAHCPDTIDYANTDHSSTPLTMVGAWGARYQDVQIHVGDAAFAPSFYADSARTVMRPVTSWRNRTSTRVGDFVCHRGERSGYSCAEVEYVDYGPPGALCAGPCEPYYVAVKGPHCQGGDSGGPVFAGTIAFGTVKGASYVEGVCRRYYYMSTDYLPPGWTLLHQ